MQCGQSRFLVVASVGVQCARSSRAYSVCPSTHWLLEGHLGGSSLELSGIGAEGWRLSLWVPVYWGRGWVPRLVCVRLLQQVPCLPVLAFAVLMGAKGGHPLGCSRSARCPVLADPGVRLPFALAREVGLLTRLAGVSASRVWRHPLAIVDSCGC